MKRKPSLDISRCFARRFKAASIELPTIAVFLYNSLFESRLEQVMWRISNIHDPSFQTCEPVVKVRRVQTVSWTFGKRPVQFALT